MEHSLATFHEEPVRILDFDTECRPMHYSEWRPESQITAYAWSWVGEAQVRTGLLRHRELERELRAFEREILTDFLAFYDQADIVTGHYLLKHDLPLLNDHCIRLGLEPLGKKLVIDTKVHMPQIRSLGLSQENLGDLFRIDERKHHMSGRLWALANELTREGRAQAKKRVVDDVLQHKAILAKLLERDVLGPPQVWSP